MSIDSDRQITVDNTETDGTSFKLPGDTPGESPFNLENNDAQQWDWYVHIENGFDVAVDVSIEGTHKFDSATNDTLDSPATDGGTESVTAGAIDFFNGTTQHSKLQLDVDPQADPTSGSLIVTLQARKY